MNLYELSNALDKQPTNSGLTKKQLLKVIEKIGKYTDDYEISQVCQSVLKDELPKTPYLRID